MIRTALIEVRIPDRSEWWEAKLKDRKPQAGDERWVFRMVLQNGFTMATIRLWTWHRYVIGPKGTVILSADQRWESGLTLDRPAPKVPLSLLLEARRKLMDRIAFSVDHALESFIESQADAPEAIP